MDTTPRPLIRCVVCEELPAMAGHPVCARCSRDVEWRESWENEIPNEPTCVACGSVLHRGHCYDCLDRTFSDTRVPA